MVFQYVILFNSDRELATTIHEASHYFDFLVTICIILYHFAELKSEIPVCKLNF